LIWSPLLLSTPFQFTIRLKFITFKAIYSESWRALLNKLQTRKCPQFYLLRCTAM
jgi:hypothetical protein